MFKYENQNLVHTPHAPSASTIMRMAKLNFSSKIQNLYLRVKLPSLSAWRMAWPVSYGAYGLYEFGWWTERNKRKQYEVVKIQMYLKTDMAAVYSTCSVYTNVNFRIWSLVCQAQSWNKTLTGTKLRVLEFRSTGTGSEHRAPVASTLNLVWKVRFSTGNRRTEMRWMPSCALWPPSEPMVKCHMLHVVQCLGQARPTNAPWIRHTSYCGALRSTSWLVRPSRVGHNSSEILKYTYYENLLR